MQCMWDRPFSWSCKLAQAAIRNLKLHRSWRRALQLEDSKATSQAHLQCFTTANNCHTVRVRLSQSKMIFFQWKEALRQLKGGLDVLAPVGNRNSYSTEWRNRIDLENFLFGKGTTIYSVLPIWHITVSHDRYLNRDGSIQKPDTSPKGETCGA